MKKKNAIVMVFVILLSIIGAVGLALIEMGAFYIWYTGKCFVGAYYYGESPENLVKGVNVVITDFWGRSQKVITSDHLVNITLYFRGWYRIEAIFNDSKEVKTITTVGAGPLYVGTIYIVLDKNDNTIKKIQYVPPPGY